MGLVEQNAGGEGGGGGRKQTIVILYNAYDKFHRDNPPIPTP